MSPPSLCRNIASSHVFFSENGSQKKKRIDNNAVGDSGVLFDCLEVCVCIMAVLQVYSSVL